MAIVMATNRFAGAFADADQCVEWVCRRWLLLLVKGFVDEAVEQRSKTDAEILCFFTKSLVLLGAEWSLCAVHVEVCGSESDDQRYTRVLLL